MHGNTMFLAQLIGVLLLVIGLSMIVQRQATLAAVDGIMKSRSLLFVVGCLQILGGVSIMLTHNVWTGGVPTVLITVIGWWVAIKGLLIMLLSPDAMAKLYKMSGFSKNYYAYGIVMLVIGVFLTYAGFWG